MVSIGKLNKLKISKVLNNGVHLDGGDKYGNILLSQKLVPENPKKGDTVEVFIYYDSKNSLIATTKKPLASADQFAYLKAVSVNQIGAFLDLGLPKDLLVPFNEQKSRMEEDQSYIVYVYLDNRTSRLIASSKIDKFLDCDPNQLTEGEKVDLLICDRTDLGYKAIINNSRWGLLYENELFQELFYGQQIKGFIKKIRDDNKIDLLINQAGYEKVEELTDIIIQKLNQYGGKISVTDKSSPAIINKMFGVSKKTYKKALGSLYKKRLISISNDYISIISK